ncbi:polysaccharide lyase 8 family protein [Bacteroides thetaiotaomicron]|uniref:polysaccharide lyase 8 family protein n=1 Tax=Bacteroides thetaiotaomicron TaxID=818 RepID=UPI001C3869DC|nr:polysaccharide lyase 8 family protein [Bacteroides thetaiotaomicron]MBV4309578.1 polysaccharide lyase 8 family protein [Bacteroides thetaiotaomicron]MBV4328708.1 polysaccharide lyase 8 family protein [Bacteroides thetaiotaomicron]MCB7382438.1 polysaccharide lyase 8 family protein [Bacteroides thetaiotaomicron]MCG4882673.1 polysaccharide lyase 8 family protein [Bacteroides thetaiotaomicron]MCQ5249295.1 polysaccharide lyase 8 family protein [Bacteroides thetaiotaomicron]
MIHYKIIILLLLAWSPWDLVLPCPSICTSGLQNDDFDILMKKIRDGVAENPNIDKALELYDDVQGCFIDIDYARRDRTNWMPLIHVDRLYDFVFAYTHPKNSYYQNEDLYHKIVKGLEYWHHRNPHCNNWWYNQIAEPQKLGILLIQMRVGKRQIPEVLETKVLQRMRKDGGHPARWTGANRTDIALHWIYRACLQKNDVDLKTAVENVYSPLSYTVKEGFQHDNSYFQHGVQLYIGGYGDEILKGVTQVALYTKGTKYALDDERIQFLRHFMCGTYYQVIRGQYMLFDVLGRGVSRNNGTQKSHAALFAKRMLELDPAHIDEYNAIIARLEGKKSANYGIKPLHTHYFRGDYALHVRPHYTFDVRMVSNRTMRCEYGNGENLKTYFMSDGCTNIVTEGDEYARIFPVWNWNRIPGVTAPQLDTIPRTVIDWQTKGTSVFAGGVSDSLYGVSVYSYLDTYADINTAAKKSWFFFDDEIICLGAGINSTAGVPVCTTINQCLLSKKEVILSQSKKQSMVKEGDFVYDSPEWVLHNGIGYVFPAGGNLFLSKKIQTGSWYSINHTESKNEQQQEVFTLGFNHGCNPRNATYAYIVVPGIHSARKMNNYRKSPVEILANTDSMQIVRHTKLGIWQMVFYKESTFRNGELSVSVDKACALMIKDGHSGNAELHIADPGQTQSCIKVELLIPEISSERKTVLCDFRNTGIYAGASKAYKLKNIL